LSPQRQKYHPPSNASEDLSSEGPWRQKAILSIAFCDCRLSTRPAPRSSSRTGRRSARRKVSPHAGYVATLPAAALDALGHGLRRGPPVAGQASQPPARRSPSRSSARDRALTGRRARWSRSDRRGRPRVVRSASTLTLPEARTRRLMEWSWPTSSRSRGRTMSLRCRRILGSVAQRSLLPVGERLGHDLRAVTGQVLGELHADAALVDG